MSLEYINAFAFAFHLSLLFVKLWALYAVSTLFVFNKAPRANSYMVVVKRFEVAIFFFTLIITLSEMYFLYCFFLDLDVYFYEYLAVTDQIALTLLITHFIIKGGYTDGTN